MIITRHRYNILDYPDKSKLYIHHYYKGRPVYSYSGVWENEKIRTQSVYSIAHSTNHCIVRPGELVTARVVNQSAGVGGYLESDESAKEKEKFEAAGINPFDAENEDGTWLKCYNAYYVMRDRYSHRIPRSKGDGSFEDITYETYVKLDDNTWEYKGRILNEDVFSCHTKADYDALREKKESWIRINCPPFWIFWNAPLLATLFSTVMICGLFWVIKMHWASLLLMNGCVWYILYRYNQYADIKMDVEFDNLGVPKDEPKGIFERLKIKIKKL